MLTIYFNEENARLKFQNMIGVLISICGEILKSLPPSMSLITGTGGGMNLRDGKDASGRKPTVSNKYNMFNYLLD